MSPSNRMPTLNLKSEEKRPLDTIAARKRAKAKLEKDIEDYLAKGGKITEVESSSVELRHPPAGAANN